MPRLHHALDDVQIRHWIAKGEPVAKADGDGLTFTLSGSGTATWVLRYSRGNRRRELTIGNYPDMSLAAARKAARAFRVEIDKGEDPAADKKTEKARTASALTVRQLCDDYKEKAMVSLAEGSVYNRNWDIENMVKPNLGSLEARKVTSADIIYMLETSGKSWNVCNRVLGTVTDQRATVSVLIAPPNACDAVRLPIRQADSMPHVLASLVARLVDPARRN